MTVSGIARWRQVLAPARVCSGDDKVLTVQYSVLLKF